MDEWYVERWRGETHGPRVESFFSVPRGNVVRCPSFSHNQLSQLVNEIENCPFSNCFLSFSSFSFSNAFKSVFKK